MKISIDINAVKSLGSYENRIDALVAAGFDAYDFSMFDEGTCSWLGEKDYLKKAEALRAYADKAGIECNQAHAPFPLVFVGNEKRTSERFDEIIRALEIAHVLGGKLCVVHPWNGYTAQQNAQIYKRIEPYARKLNLKIALENMWFWDEKNNCASPAACSDENDFNAHLDLLDNSVFVGLVDTGHAEMRGLGTGAAKMIKALGNRMEGIHLHDNDLWHDMHTLPFVMYTNYAPVIQALREINYKGDITLECEGFLRGFPVKLVPSALKLMAEVANYFREEVCK